MPIKHLRNGLQEHAATIQGGGVACREIYFPRITSMSATWRGIRRTSEMQVADNRNSREVRWLLTFYVYRTMLTHYGDVIMGAITSQITSLTIVYSTVNSDADQTSKLRVTGLCVGNSPGTGEFPAQMASNAEDVSICWRHNEKFYHVWKWDRDFYLQDYTFHEMFIFNYKIKYLISQNSCVQLLSFSMILILRWHFRRSMTHHLNDVLKC